MIGDRVRWAHTDQHGQPLFPDRSGVVRAVALANGQWHVLVQGANGEYRSELASNLAAEIVSSFSCSARDTDELAARLAERSDAITRLDDYIREQGLDDVDAPEPCALAIDLLKSFQAELLAVGAARDDARTERDEAVSRLTSAYDTAKAERDALATELEAARKRKRPPGRSAEDSP